MGHLATLQGPSQQAWAWPRYPAGHAALAASSCHVGQFCFCPSKSFFAYFLHRLLMGASFLPEHLWCFPRVAAHSSLGALSDGRLVSGVWSLLAVPRRALLSYSHVPRWTRGHRHMREERCYLPCPISSQHFSPLPRVCVVDFFSFSY